MESELRKRVITGACLGIVIIAATIAGKITAYVLVILILTGSAIEYFRMQSVNKTEFGLLPLLLCILPVSGMLPNPLAGETAAPTEAWSSVVFVMMVTFALYFILNIRATMQALIARLKVFSTAWLLFTIPGLFAIYLCGMTPILLLGVFILIWSSDVFAYFIGKAIGKHKLAPSISPKKTWEGFFGGCVATILAAWGLSWLFSEISIQDWMITGALVAIFGTLGDLLQSAFKRAAGVKDSGTILPGHGGFWDRFDSFLGCISWVGAYFLML